MTRTGIRMPTMVMFMSTLTRTRMTIITSTARRTTATTMNPGRG